MAKLKPDEKPGYGKLLDAWIAPDDAGDPVGCLATSFTFSPVFFEEECLTRFLQLESDPNEDGPVYLVEREEKLAQLSCAAALVDQHHCRGSRSLRWDLLSARLPRGLQHAKVSLLYWSRLIRIIIGSANLTDDGYRRNQEVFGVLDFRANGESPPSCLVDTVAFLRKVALSSRNADGVHSPALGRWNSLLDRALRQGRKWGAGDTGHRRNGVRLQTLFTGPGYPSVFESLKNRWPGGSPPDSARVLSPFFDQPDLPNAPAKELWTILRQRGWPSVEFHIAAEEIPGEDAIFLFAPRSLLDAQPLGRANATTDFFNVQLADGRPLHAKGIWLNDDRWHIYLIGSSNFTSAGMGLTKTPNFEANIVYIVDSNRDSQVKKQLNDAFPGSDYVDLDGDVRWKPRSGEGEDEVAGEILLPKAFGDAVFQCDNLDAATVKLSIIGNPPVDWQLITDGGEQRCFGDEEWCALGRPSSVNLPWKIERPPSGFWVRWNASNGGAWWPVNVLCGNTLPPPTELRDLPLEVLINILSSARPLHRVLGEYLRRRERELSQNDNKPIVDPHKRVDTSQFLLQRTRRVSAALNALRDRLERPVVTPEFLQWRLHGPVGVMALAKALAREAQSSGERAFLISELVLELDRVKPRVALGCLPPNQHLAQIRSMITELRSLIPDKGEGEPETLRRYVEAVFAKVSM